MVGVLENVADFLPLAVVDQVIVWRAQRRLPATCLYGPGREAQREGSDGSQLQRVGRAACASAAGPGSRSS
jgi:hypothetical protein